MLDIHFLRENQDKVKLSEKKRGREPAIVDEVLNTDEQWRKSLKNVEELKHTRNVVSEEINAAKKAKQNALAEQKIKRMREVAEEIRQGEEKADGFLRQRNETLKRIGNVLDKAVPLGKDENDNKEIKKSGKVPKFPFPIKDHIELGLELDLFELDTAASVAGARFYYLKNEAILLDLALQRFAMDVLLRKGFVMYCPPFMLNRAALEGGVNLTEFQDTIYKIDTEDLYLIGTSEHALIALQKDKLLQEKDLPLRIGGLSTCFRKELGAHGRDTKGIFRVHQFNKVEMIVFCRPKDSMKLFTEMEGLSEYIFEQLGIPFRVVSICSGDIGNKQSLQYDIEAWFPGQNEKKGTYREVTSCSNCLEYQAVTLNTRFVTQDGTKGYTHILNNTAIATSRAMVAILENFQTKGGSVKIPKVLWPYMGMKEIKRKK
ncbi:serine--tRNA ligase [Candidatus Woesearchaeota archaeon]|nr:serine--tRNA ligase [Candidatus Woesearchaeota archaeon]